MRLQIVFILLTLSNLTAQTAFVTGSGYVAPPSIVVAPGQIATFFVGGLPQTASALQNTVAQVVSGSVTQAATVISAKPVDASTLAVTVQMPFTILPGTTASIQFGQAAEGQSDPCAQNTCTAPVTLSVTPVLAHVITTCDVFYATPTTTCQLAVTHQDGSIVTNAAPANGGEVLTIWALGLGVPASGIPAAGGGAVAMNDITLNTFFETTVPSQIPLPNQPTPYLWAGLPSPATGLYQINFVVPQPPTTLQSCGQTTEWFVNSTGGGNMEVTVFRLVPVTSTAPITGSSGFTWSALVVNASTDYVDSICVTR